MGSRSTISRRTFLGYTTLGAAGLTIPAFTLPRHEALASPRLGDYPFTLGIASGEPLPTGVVLWTRLAPDPLVEDGSGGMPPDRVPVAWQVATDEQFADVVKAGAEVTTPELNHSVHVEVSGLEPGRDYFYRFLVGPDMSPTGRTRTAPPFTAPNDRLSFAFASCQNFPDGYFVAYRDMASHDLDLVVFLGDYMYEGTAQGSIGRGHLPARETVSLADYRLRYAQYKTDPDLQTAHAAFPWVCVYDDHEVDNNWNGDMNDPAFLARRAAAFKAFYENMPLRRSSMPDGPSMKLYRRTTYGSLAEFHVLDTRQYRSAQASCTDAERIDGYCPAALDPDRTILGDAQERDLHQALATSPGHWNVLANQLRMTPYDNLEGPGRSYRVMDTWGDGYVVDREQLLDVITASRVSNPVVVTGDAHKNWVFDMKDDFADPASATVATEFIGTSISSAGDSLTVPTRYGGTEDNPYEVFTDGHRGYVRCEVDRQVFRAEFRICDTVRTPDGTVSPLASFVVESGRPGARRA